MQIKQAIPLQSITAQLHIFNMLCSVVYPVRHVTVQCFALCRSMASIHIGSIQKKKTVEEGGKAATDLSESELKVLTASHSGNNC